MTYYLLRAIEDWAIYLIAALNSPSFTKETCYVVSRGETKGARVYYSSPSCTRGTINDYRLYYHDNIIAGYILVIEWSLFIQNFLKRLDGSVPELELTALVVGPADLIDSPPWKVIQISQDKDLLLVVALDLTDV